MRYTGPEHLNPKTWYTGRGSAWNFVPGQGWDPRGWRAPVPKEWQTPAVGIRMVRDNGGGSG